MRSSQPSSSDMLVPKTLHCVSGHLGELVHEDRDSSLSEVTMLDTDITLTVGLGLQIDDNMAVTAVSEKGQAWNAQPRIEQNGSFLC